MKKVETTEIGGKKLADMANESRQRGQNGRAQEVSTKMPPFTNPDDDAFLQKLLTQVVQVVQETISQELKPREDLGDNLIKIHKMNPPEFEDSLEPGDILDWMTEMEKLFSVFKPPEEQKVAIATHYLKKSSYEWWEACKPTDHDPTWEDFKAKMESRYYPQALRNEEKMEIYKPRPEDETVDQAARMFYRILRINPSFLKDEKSRIRAFEMRMSAEIRKYLAGHLCETLEKYVTMALELEAGWEASYRESSSSKRVKTEASDYSVQCCFNCGSEDHLKPDCSYPPRNCHGCGRLGHMVAFCRNKRNQM